MGHQVIKLQNPLKTLGFLQFYRFKTVKDRIIDQFIMKFKVFLMQSIFLLGQKSFGTMKYIIKEPKQYIILYKNINSQKKPAQTYHSAGFFQIPYSHLPIHIDLHPN